MNRKDQQPTPLDWAWWWATIVNIALSFCEPLGPTAAELFAQVDDRDARMREALRAGTKETRH